MPVRLVGDDVECAVGALLDVADAAAAVGEEVLLACHAPALDFEPHGGPVRDAPTERGELTAMDPIFVLLIAEAATHAMGSDTSVADGLVLVASIVGWNDFVDAPSHRVPAVER